MNSPRLYLNFIADFDWLIALEFGRVDDAQHPEDWRGVSESFGFLCDGLGGRELGFKILRFSEFDPDDPEISEIWNGPRFHAPVLGLIGATAGEITTAAKSQFSDESTVNRRYFDMATLTEGEDSLSHWQSCLQSGDSMAHFGLGCTLYELGRYPEAYRHLRYYTEIAPCGSWNWCWLGKAARDVGEIAEARKAFERCLELEQLGDHETDAQELLDKLDDSDPPGVG